ncbi:hypothetical protein HK101_008562 [Irineochytrium annulatum]|nr:hypothetical protein HK101_008562 [Irineochytrium annulatum]
MVPSDLFTLDHHPNPSAADPAATVNGTSSFLTHPDASTHPLHPLLASSSPDSTSGASVTMLGTEGGTPQLHAFRDPDFISAAPPAAANAVESSSLSALLVHSPQPPVRIKPDPDSHATSLTTDSSDFDPSTTSRKRRRADLAVVAPPSQRRNGIPTPTMMYGDDNGGEQQQEEERKLECHLRDVVDTYLADEAGEYTMIVENTKVVQKSYGSEKRLVE